MGKRSGQDSDAWSATKPWVTQVHRQLCICHRLGNGVAPPFAGAATCDCCSDMCTKRTMAATSLLGSPHFTKPRASSAYTWYIHNSSAIGMWLHQSPHPSWFYFVWNDDESNTYLTTSTQATASEILTTAIRIISLSRNLNTWLRLVNWNLKE